MRLLLILLMFGVSKGFANDSIIFQLLNRIEQLQIKENGVFPKGMIPSYRFYALGDGTPKPDVNLFFTGLVMFTLQDVKPDLTPSQQKIAERIIHSGLPVATKFRNKKNRPTYNFWPTDTPKIFPNAGWLNYLDKRQALPDDVDDTVIMLLAAQANDSTAKQVHAIMQRYRNNNNKKVHNTPRKYRNVRAYSTWFGEKMPVDYDICVLSNVLYFVQSYNLEWGAADSASLHLIEQIIKDKKHINDAAKVSPHYSRSSSILYHLSRLMALKPIPSLEKFRTQLVEEARKELKSAKTFMDEVILSTALLRWGVTPPKTKPHAVDSFKELFQDENFSFFIANMASILPTPLKTWVEFIGIGKFYYQCTAFNNLLLAENLIWRKRRGL